jgi:hypothetical protein
LGKIKISLIFIFIFHLPETTRVPYMLVGYSQNEKRDSLFFLSPTAIVLDLAQPAGISEAGVACVQPGSLRGAK